MANKRMFTMKIVDSDAFLEMPLSTQCLYFHLNMRADDDGFIRNLKSVMRGINGRYEDLGTLIDNNFVRYYSESVCEIIHFKEMNLESYKQENRRKKKYKEWRKAVIDRDKGICQRCGSNEKICVHHKIRYRDCFDDEQILYDVDNGICLCKRCHKIVHGGNFANG